MSNVKSKTYTALVFMAELYSNEKVTEDRLAAYANMLDEELTEIEIREALRKSVKVCKFFPTIAEILELAKPTQESKEEADMIANKIMEAVTSFSFYDIKGIKEFLGDDYFIAQRFGLSTLFQMDNDQMAICKAQLRDLAKAYINKKKISNVKTFQELEMSNSTSVDRIHASNSLHRLDITV